MDITIYLVYLKYCMFNPLLPTGQKPTIIQLIFLIKSSPMSHSQLFMFNFIELIFPICTTFYPKKNPINNNLQALSLHVHSTSRLSIVLCLNLCIIFNCTKVKKTLYFTMEWSINMFTKGSCGQNEATFGWHNQTRQKSRKNNVPRS